MSHVVNAATQYIDTIAMLTQLMVLFIGYPMQIMSLVKSRTAQGAFHLDVVVGHLFPRDLVHERWHP